MATTDTNSSLAQKGNWDDFDEEKVKAEQAASQSDRPKTEYLTMDTSKPGKYTFTIRPVGPHVKCRKFFKPYRATLCDQDKETDPAWKNGWYPNKRYAINVIDRADGILKVLEKGASVFKGFANYKAVFGKNPSDAKEGADFIITVVVPKGKDGKANSLKTEYTVTHLKETPLTKEEIDMIRAKKLWPLTEIYKPTPIEKRIEMWNALSDVDKVAPKREFKDGSSTPTEEKATKVDPKPSAKVEDVMPDAPADTEDIFDTKSDETAETPDSTELF